MALHMRKIVQSTSMPTVQWGYWSNLLPGFSVSSFFMYVRSGGSGETARMHKLAVPSLLADAINTVILCAGSYNDCSLAL